MAKTGKPRGKANRGSDLPDSPRDERELKNEGTTIDMPDVKDIPGQEFIHPPNPGEFADTTISSSDEEGGDIWDEETEDDSAMVTDIEKKLLDDSANDASAKEEQQFRRAELDNTDDEGEPLNEKTNAISGSDLDTSGVDEDDMNEEIGEEDEENNPYSLGGDDNSINEERSGV